MNEFDIWLSFVLGTDCSNGNRISEKNISPDVLYKNRANWGKFDCFTEKQIETASKITLDDVRDICEKHRKNKIKSINYTDEKFPDKFKNISHAPLILFYKGHIEMLSEPYIVAVIGSRNCDGEGVIICENIAEDIAHSGGVVVSGMAQGIDSKSCKKCVEVGGKAIGILGVPLDVYYPKTNKDFQEMMCEKHLVISEFYSGYPYLPKNFVVRNRLIAAVSDGVCIIQAHSESGSLTTAKDAVEYGKQIFTVPGSIFNKRYEGSNNLLVEGKATAVVDGKQIMAHLGANPEDTKEKEKIELEPNLQIIYDCIEGAMAAGKIIRITKMKPSVVKAGLTQLEMDGYITRTESGEYIQNK